MNSSRALLQQLRQPSPLLLALLCATGLHAIVLAALGARPAAKAPGPSTADDNSPELVRLSRQQAGDATSSRAANPLSLPALSSLPLPRWNDIPDQRNASGQRERSHINGENEAQTSPANCPGSGPGRTRQASATGAPREAMLSALARLQTLARENPGKPVTAEGLPPLLWPQSEARGLWSRLWEASIAVPGSEVEMPAAAGMDLRRISLGRARSLGLPAGDPRRQAVVIGDRLLLIWPQGEQLWLLQGSIARSAEAEPPAP
ncbi:MAG: hypothetical protein WCF98_09410 [Synechococcus sp. ELA057]